MNCKIAFCEDIRNINILKFMLRMICIKSLFLKAEECILVEITSFKRRFLKSLFQDLIEMF